MTAGPIHDTALAWYDAGACVLPAAADGSKRPALAWDHYKTERPERGELDTWSAASTGIGIVCGTVSGNVEMFEAEAAAVEEGMHTQLMEMLPTDLRDKLNTYVERSPKGGVHWIFRVDGMPVKGNTKLARRPGEVDAWSGKPGQSVEVLFETRGEGGWTVVAPSNGPTHPSGKPWQVIYGTAGVIPLLSAEEYRVLHACAATFNQIPERFGGQAPGAVWVPPAASTAEGTPGQDFEGKATWEEILIPAGWTKVRQRGEVTEWVRPGKSPRDGISATTGWQGDWLYVFSTSTEFESERTYTKFGAYCVAPETRVLKADLAWTQAGDLRAGDALVGVDEYIASKNGRRKLRLSYVESAERRTLPCYRITLADGRSIVASDEHPWLAASAGLGGNLRWIPTNRLRPGQRICSLTRGTWETATDFDSGWLSGMYDGEGWASGGIVGLSQKPGVVLDRAERLLRERGFSPSHKPVSTGSAENLTIASLPDILRLLGTLQPSRLVSKMQWIGRGAWTQAAPNAIVAAVEYVGERETAAFMTTARTFIAEGLVTHNTLLHHHGDFSAAAGELRKAGYGAPRQPQSQPLALVPQQGNVTDGTPAPAAPPADGLLNLTDAGNADLFVAEHAHHLRYVPERGHWLTWDGVRWAMAPDDAPAVQAMLAVVEAIDPGDNQALFRHRQRSLNYRPLQNAVALARSNPTIRARLAQLDADPYALNTPTGVIDLRTGRIGPGRPEQLHTRTTGVPYDPDAAAPRWLQFLSDTFEGDQELIDFVQRLSGYSATGKVTHHVLPFLHGSGGNGKTVLVEAHLAALGDYATTAPADFLLSGGREDEAAVARLAGQRLVVCSEVNQAARFNEAKIKLLTGGDKITARFLYHEHFTFAPTHQLWLMANHQPRVDAGGEGFWRRLRLVPFRQTVTAEQRIEGLADILVAEEGPGILRWIVDGARMVLRDGLQEPGAVLSATAQYAEEEDALGRFMEEHCHLGGGHLIRVETRELRSSYEQWCFLEGEKPISPQMFGRELRGRWGIGQTKSNGRKFYTGVTLLQLDRSEPEQSEMEWWKK